MKRFIINDGDGGKCKKCSDNVAECRIHRNDFFKDCLPIINMLESPINIVNFAGDDYISYNPNNKVNYIMKNDFTLEPMKEKLPLKPMRQSINIFKSIIGKSVGTLSNVPIYYMFCDIDKVFNFFGFFAKHNKKYKDGKGINMGVVNRMFRFDDSSRFVGLSFYFNILSVSLMCGKFFDIYPHLVSKSLEKDLKDRPIEKIFDINISNLYLIFDEYYKKVQQIKKINMGTNEYGKNPVGYDEIDVKIEIEQKDKAKIDHIVGLEKNTDSKNFDNILKNFIEEVTVINKILNEINEYIPDFPNLFMMSYLSYRIKEKYIKGSWGYSFGNLVKYINENAVVGSKYIEGDKIIEYYKEVLPIIYKHQTVTFEDDAYPNCMENVLLQFLKILFWNNEKKIYDPEIVDLLIDEIHSEKIKKIMADVDTKQLTNEFTYEWVKYVTELMRGDKKDSDMIKKIFVRKSDNLDEAKELDATLFNLMTFVKKIFKKEFLVIEKDNKIHEETDENILQNIVTKIVEDDPEGSSYSAKIEINKETNEDNIALNLYNKFEIILEHNTHAHFVGELDNARQKNIINEIYDNKLQLSESIGFPEILRHESSRWISYKNIDAYLCTDISLHDKDIIVKYINNMGNDKSVMYIEMLFTDGLDKKIGKADDFMEKNNIDGSIISLWLTSSKIATRLNEHYETDNEFWSEILKKINKYPINLKKIHLMDIIKNDTFWQGIVEKIVWNQKTLDDVMENWHDNVEISNELFWGEFVKIEWSTHVFDVMMDNLNEIFGTSSVQSYLFWKKFMEEYERKNKEKFFIHVIQNIIDFKKNKFIFDKLLKTEWTQNIVFRFIDKWVWVDQITDPLFWEKFAKIDFNSDIIDRILQNRWRAFGLSNNSLFWKKFLAADWTKDNIGKMMGRWKSDTVEIKNESFWDKFIISIDDHDIEIILTDPSTANIESAIFWRWVMDIVGKKSEFVVDEIVLEKIKAIKDRDGIKGGGYYSKYINDKTNYNKLYALFR
jgi:hypothetical protein